MENYPFNPFLSGALIYSIDGYKMGAFSQNNTKNLDLSNEYSMFTVKILNIGTYMSEQTV